MLATSHQSSVSFPASRYLCSNTVIIFCWLPLEFMLLEASLFGSFLLCDFSTESIESFTKLPQDMSPIRQCYMYNVEYLTLCEEKWALAVYSLSLCFREESLIRVVFVRVTWRILIICLPDPLRLPQQSLFFAVMQGYIGSKAGEVRSKVWILTLDQLLPITVSG